MYLYILYTNKSEYKNECRAGCLGHRKKKRERRVYFFNLKIKAMKVFQKIQRMKKEDISKNRCNMVIQKV